MQDQATLVEQASFNPALRLIKAINVSHLTCQDLFSFFPFCPYKVFVYQVEPHQSNHRVLYSVSICFSIRKEIIERFCFENMCVKPARKDLYIVNSAVVFSLYFRKTQLLLIGNYFQTWRLLTDFLFRFPFFKGWGSFHYTWQQFVFTRIGAATYLVIEVFSIKNLKKRPHSS